MLVLIGEIMKNLLNILVVTLVGLSMTACWESDTENAVEDVGENIERTAEDAADATEDAAEEAEEAVDPE